jgi:hypothetical protein
MFMARDSLFEKSWNAAVKMITSALAVVFVSAAQIHSVLVSKTTSRLGIKHSVSASFSSSFVSFGKNAGSKKK